MKKNILLIKLLVIFIFSFSLTTPVLAKGETIDIGNEDKIIMDLGNNVNVYGSFSKNSINAISSNFNEKRYDLEGYFYVVSSGKTVAEYGVTIMFAYDGNTSKVNNQYSWSRSLDSDWSVYNRSFAYDNTVTATFTLFYQNETSLNNQVVYEISCDKNGVITYTKN